MRKAMQAVAMAALLSSSLAFAQSKPASSSKDESVSAEDRRQIEQLVQQNDRAIQKGDVEKFSAHFTEDATLVNPIGHTLEGQAEIREQYTKDFEGVLDDTTAVTTITTLRPIAPGVILLDAERVLRGPNLPSGPGEPLKVHLTGILEKSGEGFRIADARSFTFLDPEAPAVGGAGQAGQDAESTCPCPMMEEGMGPMGPPTMREQQRD